MSTPQQAPTIPVMILKEGTGRTRGRSAQRNNITAAKVISDVLKSTLGPRGMDKMVVDTLGDVTITNDGNTILKEIDVQHPAAKMMVDAAKAQDNEVGDGTTSVVVLAGELLKRAEELLDQNIHSTIVVSGFKKATDKALEILGKIAVDVDVNNRDILKKAAITSMRSKTVASWRDMLADLAIDAIARIAEKRGDTWVVDVDQVQITKKAGGSVADTSLVKGVILDKEVVHSGMPKRIEKAAVALLDSPLEIEKTEISAEIRIKDPAQMKAFLDEETRMLKELVDKIKASGANVVVCQKGIDDIAQHFLAKEGILAVRRAKKSDMEKLSRACGATIVTNIDDLKAESLGKAELVEERKIGDDKMVFIEGCKNPKSVGLLIRGGFERLVDEAERGIHDALYVVADIYKSNKIVAGGGASEAELAKHLRKYASKVGGREQLAIEAFAESLESIPRTLAENAGLDPIDIIVSLRSAHDKAEGLWDGVNVFSGRVENMMNLDVIEPLRIKEQVVKTASEVASMILRIDDVVTAAKTKPPTPSKGGGESFESGGMPGGAGGMPPEY